MNQREILRDMTRRWQKSYVHVADPSGDETLYFVDRIQEDEERIAKVFLTSPEVGKITINLGSAHQLKFKYPPVGVFQHGKDALMFVRIPERQYVHGLCEGNSAIQAVTARLSGGGSFPLDFEYLVSAFNQERYTFSDAVRMLKSGKFRSVAMFRNFSLSLSATEPDGFTLFYWNTAIASLAPDSSVRRLYDEGFKDIVEQLKN